MAPLRWMRRRCCVVALVMLVGCGPASTPDAGTPDTGAPDATLDAGRLTSPLRIATWNIENFPRHRDTISSVASVIQEEELDLVAVQEVVDDLAFGWLDEELPDHDVVIADDPRAFQRLALIYRRSRVAVSDVDVLFTGDRSAFPRSPLAARVEVRRGDDVVFDFTVVVVHLKASIDNESRLRRVAAIEALDGWMRARVEGVGDPDIVLLGDFNDNLTDEPSQNVFGPLLDAERYTFLTLPLEASGARTFLFFDAFLDHVMLTESARQVYGDGTTEILPLDQSLDDYTTRVSDHLPVVVTFGR
ncbi:MAG: endonuclease/exonuclease/phosphatase family protein [Sandaracinaceae bacterium]